MKDLIQCPVARDDFQRWLDLGKAPLDIRHGERIGTVLSRLEKNPSVDYLYRTAVEQDNTISWNNSPTFCGVYDMNHRVLYLTKDSLPCFMNGKYPFIAEAGQSMTENISGRISRRVEDIISNDRNNLPIRELTDYHNRHDLQYYQEYGAKEEAIRRFFDGSEPDGQFHSGYKLNVLPESTFMAYLQDSEAAIQTEAEQYIRDNQEQFLVRFMVNDALLTEYHALMQDTDNPIHKMKAITDAVKGSGAKTVTVTVQKDGQELTFKTPANSLTGHKNCYSTYDIPAPDRRKFENLFGRYSDYTAEDIARIAYGRQTIYEAPQVQVEEPSVNMVMGGM